MMDAILTQLLSFPPHPPPTPSPTDAEYDKQAKAQIQTISKIPPSKLLSGVTGSGNPLDILNPSINSISYVYLLLAHITNGSGKQKNLTISDAFAPDRPLWLKALEFVERFDPVQVRYSGTELRRLIEIMVHVAFTVHQPWVAIAPVRSAILRMDPSSSTFTSSHMHFVYLCLAARAYAAALPILDQDIYHFPALTTKGAEAAQDPLFPYLCSSHESSSTYISASTGLTSKLEYHDHLQYFLFGAMCYMGLKDWERAILFLEIVLVSPTAHTASKIQVEAYKKWVLVSVLLQGKLLPLPKTTNTQASKMYKSLGKPYTGLAETFERGIQNEESVTKVVSEAQAADKVWVDDCNAGLIRQVIQAYRLFSVRRLEKTYAALTISDVTKRTSDDANDYAETGQYVIKLISNGELNATISKPSEDPATWILRFANSANEGPGVRSEEQHYDDLSRQMARVKTLMTHIKEADRKYGVSKEYIQEVKQIMKGKENAPSGEDGASWAPPNEAFDHDEDIMAELQ